MKIPYWLWAPAPMILLNALRWSIPHTEIKAAIVAVQAVLLVLQFVSLYADVKNKPWKF